MKLSTIFHDASITQNPAWVQLLGLCPLLAVSSSLVNALALSAATAFVIVGANSSVAALAPLVPRYARLPSYVLIIATFTTTAMLLMQAFAYPVYLAVALFVQIIVTNCMILGRAEAFASRQGVLPAAVDALGTAFGFAIALVTLGMVRELLGAGTMFADLDRLFGPAAAGWVLEPLPEGFRFTLAALPPGAFLLAGLLLALGRSLQRGARLDRARDGET